MLSQPFQPFDDGSKDAMKKCTMCGLVKASDDYYRHPFGADGRMSRCKDCTKRAARINYRENRKHYQAYERARCQNPERRRKAREYQSGRLARAAEKYRARTAVGNAVRDGRLVPQPCEVCGSEKVQAHHEDYSKPLDVIWLCFEHHRARHGQTADAAEGVRSFDVNRTRRKAA